MVDTCGRALSCWYTVVVQVDSEMLLVNKFLYQWIELIMKDDHGVDMTRDI